MNVSGTGASGSASTWNVGNSGLLVGYQSSATLNITGGGKVTTGAMPTYLNYSTGSSSTLNINGGSLTSDTLVVGSGSVAISLTNPTAANGGGYALNLGGSNGSSTIGVAIADATGGAGGIRKTGTGTLTLNAANTFSGGMQIDGGSVVMGSASALQNSTAIINVNNGLNVNGAQSISLGGLAGTGSLAISSTSLGVGSNNQSTTYSGSLAASGFGKTGNGTLTLTNASNTIANIADFTQGTTRIQAGTGTGSTSFTVPLADIGSYTTGDATVTVSGTNANGAPALLNLTDTSNYAASLFVGVGNGGTATLNVLGGAKVMSHGAYLGYNAGTTGIVTVSGTDASGRPSTWDFGAGSTGDIAIGGNGVGIVNIQAGGTVTGNYTAVAPFGGTAALLNIDGGRLITNLFSADSGSVKLTNPTAANGGGFALNISDGGDAAVAITDASGGAGGIQKTGTRTLTLSGASTYTGGTLVGTGRVVGSGGTISGTSLVSGALGKGLVTVAAGATLSVGQAPNTATTNRPGFGTLALSALTLTGGSATPLLTFDLGATGSLDGSTNDLLKFSGSANSLVFSGAGAFNVSFASATGSAISGTPSYELMTFATPIDLASATVGDPNSKFKAVGTGNLTTPPAGTFSWMTTSGKIVGLRYGSAADAPEPAALALLLGSSGFLTIAAYRPRRRVFGRR